MIAPERKALSKTNVIFNPERALEVAAALKKAHAEKRGLFGEQKTDSTPEHTAVKGIASNLDAACLLFCAIGTDRGVQSRIHYPKFRQAYDHDPRSIYPTTIAGLSLRTVRKQFLERYGIGMKQVTEQIYISSSIVRDQFDGDPRNLFSDISCVHDAVIAISDDKSKRKLPGFGPQVSRLLLKNYTELGLVQFPNQDEATPKVDIHAKRIAIGTGILTFTEEGRYHSWALDGVLNDGYQALCESGQLDGREFNSLLWSVGNQLCNRKDERVCLHHCPLYETLCTKLPFTNYRASGDRNDGTIDTRIDDRIKRADLLFSLDALTETPLRQEEMPSVEIPVQGKVKSKQLSLYK